MLLPETLRQMAEAYPHEVAYSIVDGGAMTFSDWDGQANRLARGLVTEGVAPGDRVALHVGMDNALRWLVSYAAIHRAGGVAVPLNVRLGAAEVEHMLAHCDATGGGGRRGAGGPRPRRCLDLVVDAGGALESRDGADGTLPKGRVVAWESALDHEAGPMQVPRGDDDLADILYTSGTTGRPKGVAVRHVNASMLPPVPPSWSGGSWLHASPMTTFAGLAFVYNPMKLGLRCIYMPRFDAGRWIEAVEQERPMAVFLVPAMTHLLLDHPRFDDADLSSVQLCTVGSAPLAPFVIERLQEKMPDAVVSNNYGMTEAGSVYCLTPKGESVRRPGSVGQPAPPAEVKIVGPDGAALPIGEVGEVRLHIPGRPREYFGDPEATASTWVDGWLVTGDLGRVDEDGYLYIVGRSKDVIIRGGNNVHAADVEHVIVEHPAVKEAAVVGVPHPVLGEDVVGVVVLHPGAEATARTTFGRTASSMLADYKVPREWRFVDELPRNPTGKVVKPEVRRDARDPGRRASADRRADRWTKCTTSPWPTCCGSRLAAGPGTPPWSAARSATRYPELHERTSRLANALLDAGVGTGDRVLWLGQNCHRVIELLLACAKIGAVFSPANWRQSADELVTLLDDSTPAVVVWQAEEIGEAVGEARRRWAGKAVWVQHDAGGPDRTRSLVASGSSEDPALPVDPAWPVLQLYTAAFGGRPNGALLAHRAILAQDLMVALVQRITEETVYLNSGPMFHMATLMTTFATLRMGGTNVLTRRVDAEELCRVIETERCNYGFVMGPTAQEILEVNKDGRYDLSSLRTFGGNERVERHDPGRRQPMGDPPGGLRPDRGDRHAHLQRPRYRHHAAPAAGPRRWCRCASSIPTAPTSPLGRPARSWPGDRS